MYNYVNKFLLKMMFNKWYLFVVINRVVSFRDRGVFIWQGEVGIIFKKFKIKVFWVV